MNLTKTNPVIQQLVVDNLYHFGIDTTMDLDAIFGDIRYVVLSRFNEDIGIFVQEFAKQLYSMNEEAFEFKPLFKTERYHLYKIGPVLAVSHGVGAQSMLICLNEITKLLIHLKKTNVTFLKIGPAGSLGITPGNIVVCDNTLNYQFQPVMTNIACGEMMEYPTHINGTLAQEMYNFFNTTNTPTHVGAVVTASDYYEGQSRLNGFLESHYSQQERESYWQRALSYNVKSIDMESLYLAGFCNQLDIEIGIINHIVVNRFESDEILMNKQEQQHSQRNVSKLLSQYLIKKHHEN